jgi:hypothetical protein
VGIPFIFIADNFLAFSVGNWLTFVVAMGFLLLANSRN